MGLNSSTITSTKPMVKPKRINTRSVTNKVKNNEDLSSSASDAINGCDHHKTTITSSSSNTDNKSLVINEELTHELTNSQTDDNDNELSSGELSVRQQYPRGGIKRKRLNWKKKSKKNKDIQYDCLFSNCSLKFDNCEELREHRLIHAKAILVNTDDNNEDEDTGDSVKQ